MKRIQSLNWAIVALTFTLASMLFSSFVLIYKTECQHQSSTAEQHLIEDTTHWLE